MPPTLLLRAYYIARQAWRALLLALVFENWPAAYQNRLLRSDGEGEVEYRLREGISLRAQAGPADVQVINEVWGYRTYDGEREFQARNGWTVLDVGAHKGTFAIRAARSGEQTRVIAIEPEPENARMLRANLELNAVGNVEVIEAAAAPKAGRGDLFLSGASPAHALIAVDGSRRESIEVALVSVEGLIQSIAGPIHLLKMDIEGAEYEVLESLSESSLSRVQRIALEYHDTERVSLEEGQERLRQLLGRAGFEVRLTPSRRMPFKTAYMLFATAAQRSPAS